MRRARTARCRDRRGRPAGPSLHRPRTSVGRVVARRSRRSHRVGAGRAQRGPGGDADRADHASCAVDGPDALAVATSAALFASARWKSGRGRRQCRAGRGGGRRRRVGVPLLLTSAAATRRRDRAAGEPTGRKKGRRGPGRCGSRAHAARHTTVLAVGERRPLGQPRRADYRPTRGSTTRRRCAGCTPPVAPTVRTGAGRRTSARPLAAAATARASGARIIDGTGGRPAPRRRAGDAMPAAVGRTGARARHRVRQPVELLDQRLAVAATGVELPGGGQVAFPGPAAWSPSTDIPGRPRSACSASRTSPPPSARAGALAAEYRAVVDEPVVPAFEIIATVADAGAGTGRQLLGRGDRSSSCGPGWRPRGAAGVYVVLDLQPGRAGLPDPGPAVRGAARPAARRAGPGPGVAAGARTSGTASRSAR